MEKDANLKMLRIKKRIKRIKRFYSHLTTYIIVNAFLVLINLLTSKNGGYWFIYPLLGWGFGLLIDAANTFQFIPFLNKDWENRKINEFMEDERKKWNK